MPYKDRELQKLKNRKYQHKHYKKNKQYYMDKAAQRRLELRAWFKDIKTCLKCCVCLEDEPVCLDFHHRDQNEKEALVSKVAHKGWSKKRILAEIDKCDVVCSNCHRKIHIGKITLQERGKS